MSSIRSKEVMSQSIVVIFVDLPSLLLTSLWVITCVTDIMVLFLCLQELLLHEERRLLEDLKGIKVISQETTDYFLSQCYIKKTREEEIVMKFL